MDKKSKQRVYKQQEQALARVLWQTLERWSLLPERDNTGTKLKCPLLALADKWKIPEEHRNGICLECIFKMCVLYE